MVSMVTSLTLVSGAVLGIQNALAGSMTDLSDTLTREQISTTADHTITFTLPAGETFGDTGGLDVIKIDFDDNFVSAGTWVVGDFTFDDGTARTVVEVLNDINPTFSCSPGGGNNVGVEVDTTDDYFLIYPCSPFTEDVTDPQVFTFTIAGTAADGTYTNPASAGSYTVNVSMCDGATASCTGNPDTLPSHHSGSYAIPISDSDQVTLSATVDPTITFDLDTETTDQDGDAPYAVDLGTLSSGSVTTSDHSGVESIFIDLDTNATGGAVVTVAGANTGLNSASTSTTITLSSAEEAIVAGSAQIGLCVESVAASSGTLAAGTQYDSGGSLANCTVSNGGTPTVGRIETTATEIFNTSGAEIAGGRGEVLVKASITGATPIATDYTNTLTFIATGTF